MLFYPTECALSPQHLPAPDQNAMYVQSGTLILSMISEDADFMYPCFRAEDVEKALTRMTSKLGFHRVDSTGLRHVYTFESDDLRLIVMATPKIYWQERMCYALSGVLIKSEEWCTEVEVLPKPSFGQTVSSWRNNPKDFYKDLLDALQRLYPDRCLSAANPKLLGPGPEMSPVRRRECWDWGVSVYCRKVDKKLDRITSRRLLTA